MYSVEIEKIKKEMKNKKITIEELAKNINVSRVAVSNFFNEKSFSKNMYEKIYKYIFQCEYIEVNLLEQFTSKELLEELLKREKSR